VAIESIEVVGLGASMSQTSFTQKNRRALIDCLAIVKD
jgi:hypothetical protein